MKRTFFVVVALLFAHAVLAQPIHRDASYTGAFSQYTDPSQWPVIDGQVHWVPGDGSPATDPPDTLTHDMGHTHLQLQCPTWAELGAQDYVCKVTIKLFHTAGRVLDATAGELKGIYLGSNGQSFFPIVMDQPGPYVGDPNGLVQFTGHATINLSGAKYDTSNPPVSVNFSQHGWVLVDFLLVTHYDNGDHVQLEHSQPFYNVSDLTQAETPLQEAGIQLVIKGGNEISHLGQEASIFGLHEIEFRDMSIANVVLNPFSSPLRVFAFGYNYGQDSGEIPPGTPNPIPAGIPNGLPAGTYLLNYDPDLHMGVPGLPQHTFIGVFTDVAGNNTTTNIDYIDPLALSQSTAPMGFAAGKHRLSFTWDENTGPVGFMDFYGNLEPPNVEVKSLMNFTVTVGPSPVGCDSTLCPPVPVNTNPPMVSVPNIVGLLDGPARAAIINAGLSVGTVTTQVSTQPVGTVLSQNPAAGVAASQGVPVSFVEAIAAAPACQQNPPTVTVTGAEQIGPGQTGSFTVSVTNNDTAACALAAFAVSASATRQ